ncbi:hypothetical protein [Herminiimonas arsenitoxidans]|uniref:hypothetical protein n=1 Tax=Herminiimonas arsenitoxidans TaxID=1809410 RepID=UPI000971204A|nr:hypothetical protein [Herminiimonas arsenitoxidans]
MQLSTSYRPDTVFSKTEKGRGEVAMRCFGLNPLQRRVLIVMDGAKRFSTIFEMIPEQKLEEIVSYLVDQNFIVPTEVSAKSTKSTVQAQSLKHAGDAKEGSVNIVETSQHTTRISLSNVELIQDAEKIREIKNFMTSTATTYLGLMAAELIHRIERTKEASGLMSIVGQWHMALRESKHGNRFAGAYLDQVTNALSGQSAQLS